MNTAKIVHFLKGLQAQTSNGSVQWEETAQDQYSTDVKSVRVTLSTRPNESSFDESDYFVTFVALPEGIFISAYSDVDLKDELRNSYTFLHLLYEDARLVAKGLRGKLDEALNAFGNSDEIPF